MAVHKYGRTGRWVAQHYDAKTGKRKQVGTYDTKREATDALAAHVRGLELDAGQADVTIAEWRQRWLDAGKWRLGTRVHYTERTRALVEQHGSLELRKFGVGLARKWAEAHPSTVSVVSTMFAAAAREVDDEDRPILMFNPFTKLVRRPKAKRDLPDEWLPAEAVDLVEASARRLFGDFGADAAAMWRFAAETGIRPGELFMLEEDDLNVAAGTLMVRRAADSHMYTVGPPKSGTSREIVLSRRAAEAAASARRHAGRAGMNPVCVDSRGRELPWSTKGTPRLFSSPRGIQLWTGSWGYYWRQIRTLAQRPGMDFYEARHYCATRLLEAGLSADDVAAQLGHTNAALVLDTYGHPSKRLALGRVRAVLDDEAEAA